MPNLAREVKDTMHEDPEYETHDYREMKKSTYLIATLLLFVAECGLGSCLPDIQIVFNFISAFAVSFLSFGFPAMFFLKAEE